MNAYTTVLDKFVTDLQKKQIKINSEVLEEEVINIACLFILGKKYTNTNNISSTYSIILQNSDSVISTNFTQAAIELYPTLYGKNEATMGILGISQNITWDGMWVHLKKYFTAKHGLDITSSNFWNS